MSNPLQCVAAPFANVGYSVREGIKVGKSLAFDAGHNARQLPEALQPVAVPVAKGVWGGAGGTLTAVFRSFGSIPAAGQYWLGSLVTADSSSCAQFLDKGEPWDFK